MSEEGAQGLCLGGLSGRGDFTTLLASVRVSPFPGDLVSAEVSAPGLWLGPFCGVFMWSCLSLCTWREKTSALALLD